LWDDWSTTRLDDALLRFSQSDVLHGYPVSRLQGVSSAVKVSTVAQIKENLKSNLKFALLKPGSPWQRLVVSAMSYLQVLLPLLVVLWIVYRALNGFIGGASDRTAYVGMDELLQRGVPLQQKIRHLCDRTSILKDTELNKLLLSSGK